MNRVKITVEETLDPREEGAGTVLLIATAHNPARFTAEQVISTTTHGILKIVQILPGDRLVLSDAIELYKDCAGCGKRIAALTATGSPAKSQNCSTCRDRETKKRRREEEMKNRVAQARGAGHFVCVSCGIQTFRTHEAAAETFKQYRSARPLDDEDKEDWRLNVDFETFYRGHLAQTPDGTCPVCAARPQLAILDAAEELSMGQLKNEQRKAKRLDW